MAICIFSVADILSQGDFLETIQRNLPQNFTKTSRRMYKMDREPGKNIYFFSILTAICLLSAACGTADKPMDADTRQVIDSISTAQIRATRLELDSVCAAQRSTELPRLIDSIKQRRLKEIDEKLRTVPLQ
jgi:hypothetical protein